MKTETVVLSLTSTGTVTVPCPPGKRIRIISIFHLVPATEGQNFFVSYQRGGSVIWEGATNGASQGMTHVTWGVGNGSIIVQVQNIGDAVTNVIYRTDAVAMSAGLVDAWFEFGVQVAIGPITGGASNVVVYQVQDNN